MNQLHQRALRALIAMQVAVIEHADEDVSGTVAIKALKECNAEWQKIVRELERTGQ